MLLSFSNKTQCSPDRYTHPLCCTGETMSVDCAAPDKPGSSRIHCTWTSQIAWPSSRNLDFPCKHWPFVWDFQEAGRLAREGEKGSSAWYCELITALSSQICLLKSFGSIYSCLQYGVKTWSLNWRCHSVKDQLDEISRAADLLLLSVLGSSEPRTGQLLCEFNRHPRRSLSRRYPGSPASFWKLAASQNIF